MKPVDIDTKAPWPKRFLRVLAMCFLTMFFLLGIFAVWLRVTAADVSKLPPLKTGDIVFQTDTSGQALAIITASGSPFSHVGIVYMDAKGVPVVWEAVGPVKKTPLAEWISHGRGGRLQVMRFKKTLPASDWKKVFGWIQKQQGKPYDIYFTDGDDSFYCSELVHDALQAALGITLGTPQPVGSLQLDNAPARKLIAARWQNYPLCKGGAVKNFEDCFDIIKSQNLITPAALAADRRLEIVYSNY